MPETEIPQEDLAPKEEKVTPSPPPDAKAETKAEAPKAEGKAEPKAELDPAIVELMAKSGEQAKAVATLVKTNQQLTAKAESLATELAQLKQATLSPTELKQWQTYQKLGKPDNLQAVMTEYEQLKEQLLHTKRELVLKDAADLLHWKASVLSPILPASVSLEIREEKGKRNVLVLGAEGAATPLREYVEKNLADFLPALAKSTPANAIPRLDEGSKSTNRVSDVVEQFIANMHKAK